jgi:YbbR domain-containing protein
VRRVTDLLFGNWPLKLGAILLATVLYSGLVLGQNIRTWTGTVPVDPIRPPTGATLIVDLDPVTLIRYRAPLDVGVLSPDSFRATVDLSLVDARASTTTDIPVTVIALDQRVQIVDYQPRVIQVQLDPVAERDLPITVTLGAVPDGLSVGPPQIDPSTATIRGASSRVDSVSAVVARVTIDASALNVDRDFELVPLDANGNQVPNIEIDPQRARIRIAVARELANRSLPVVPQLIGQPAPGYRITSVTVDPLVVTVSGEASTVTPLETAMTEPIDIANRSRDIEATVGFALPSGVSVAGGDTVHVVITIAEQTGSQIFVMGYGVSGTQCECIYEYPKLAVNVTLGGSVVTLATLDTTTLAATADVSGLTAGSHSVPLSFSPPDGLEVIDISPAEVTINVVTATPVPGPT